MFFITRLLVELAAPFNVVFITLLGALVLLVMKRWRAGTAALVIGLTVLIGCGYDFGVTDIISSRENAYPPLTGARLENLPTDEVKYVVVLGSGHVSDPRLPPTSQIGSTSLCRLVEGIRLHRSLPGTKLVITGGIVYDPLPNADIVSAVAMNLGVEAQDIIVSREPRDTQEEARVVGDITGMNKIVLVTSALHMRRAMEIFQSHGMEPIPAPTDFIIKQGAGGKPPGHYLPSMGNLDLWKRLIYEWMGALWLKAQRLSEKFR